MHITNTIKAKRGAFALVAAVMLIVAGLTACDPPNTQTSDKSYSTVKAMPGLVDGEDAYVTVRVESKAAKPIYVEVSVVDGVAGNRFDSYILDQSGYAALSDFYEPEINTSNPGGVDVYVNVWSYDYVCGCRGATKLNSHNIQDLVFSND